MIHYRLKFALIALLWSIVWGILIVPKIIIYIDSNPSVSPFMASILYYGGIYLGIALFLFALIPGKKFLHVTRLAFIIFLVYLLVDWYEPPAIVSPDGHLALDAPGYKGSLDYSVGYYLNRAGLDWKRVYDIEVFLIPGVIAFLIYLFASDQLLGRAIRRI